VEEHHHEQPGHEVLRDALWGGFVGGHGGASNMGSGGGWAYLVGFVAVAGPEQLKIEDGC
jgi:hypothetical protein